MFRRNFFKGGLIGLFAGLFGGLSKDVIAESSIGKPEIFKHTIKSTELRPLMQPIRIWKLGSLEHKILPTEEQIEKFSKALEGNPQDIVWGPDIDCQVILGYGDISINEITNAIKKRFWSQAHGIDWNFEDNCQILATDIIKILSKDIK